MDLETGTALGPADPEAAPPLLETLRPPSVSFADEKTTPADVQQAPSKHYQSLSQPNCDEVGWTHEELQQMQSEDKNIGTLVTCLNEGMCPSVAEVPLTSPELKSYRTQWESITLVDSVLLTASFFVQMALENMCSC